MIIVSGILQSLSFQHLKQFRELVHVLHGIRMELKELQNPALFFKKRHAA
jgi:hypothetical protein